jgi:hypothetical protein
MNVWNAQIFVIIVPQLAVRNASPVLEKILTIANVRWDTTKRIKNVIDAMIPCAMYALTLVQCAQNAQITHLLEPQELASAMEDTMRMKIPVLIALTLQKLVIQLGLF